MPRVQVITTAQPSPTPIRCVACGKPAQFPLHDECRGGWVRSQRAIADGQARDASDRRKAISAAVSQITGAKR